MGCFSTIFLSSFTDNIFFNWYTNETSCLELLYYRLVRRKRTLIDIFEKRPDLTNKQLQYEIGSLFSGYEEAKCQLCNILIMMGYPLDSAPGIVKVLFHSSAFDEDDAEKLETLYESYVKAKAIAESFDESMFSHIADNDKNNTCDSKDHLLHIECVSCSRVANAQLRACQIQFHKILSKYILESPKTEDFLNHMVESDRQVTELNITEKLHEVHKERLAERLPAGAAKTPRTPKTTPTAKTRTVLPVAVTPATESRSHAYKKVPLSKRRVIQEFSI